MKTTLVTKRLGEKLNIGLVEKIKKYSLNINAHPKRSPNSFDEYVKGENDKQEDNSILHFFTNEEAYENLEVKELEILLGGWQQTWNGWRFTDENNGNEWKWGRFGHGLLNYFIRHPLTNTQAIEYVQEGVKELASNKNLRKRLTEILISGKGLFRTSDSFRRIRNKYYRVKSFGDYHTSLEEITDILKCAKSDSLRDISKSLTRILKNKRFTRAAKIAQSKPHIISVTGDVDVQDWGHKYPGHSIEYICSDGKKIHCFSIRNDVLDDEHDGRFNAYDPIWSAIEKTLTKQGFVALDNVAFDGAVLGYINGLASLVDIYERNGTHYTFPKVNGNGQNELYFKEGIHPFLISNNPIPNDVNLNSNPSLYVIAGANNGGKTTYIKMVGLLTILSQMGAPIPAKEARVTPVDHIYTHFPKTESVLSGNGRFVDELGRLKFILENVDKSSLVLLDEPCAGTSNEDSIDVSMEIVYGLQQIECPTIYSTHLHEIQQRLQHDGDYRNCMNLRVETKGTANKPQFTYNIRKGVAGESYGKVYAKQLLPVRKILDKRGISIS